MQKNLLTALAAVCFVMAAVAQPTTTGLMAYWPLNGNFTDAGPNVLTTTNTGVTAAADPAGIPSKAMFFNNTLSGTGTVVPATSYGAITVNAASASIGFSSASSYTVAHWFRLTSVAGSLGNGFFDNNMNYFGYGTWLWREGGAGGPLQLHFNAGGANVQSPTATVTINLNTWYHLAGVKDGATLRLYLNGVQVASNTPVGGFTAATYAQQPKFGTLWYNVSGYFNYAPFQGNLDELRLYNRALTPAEISVLASYVSGGALPIKLRNFTATKNAGAVKLQWQTELEINSSHINIQRSADGINFSTIGTVAAKGNSNVVSDYQFADNDLTTVANARTLYYRLQQVDKDGRSQLSSIVTIKTATTGTLLTLLQNPVETELRLQVALPQQQPVQLVVTDALGRKTVTKQVQLYAGQSFTTLPLPALQPGIYYITASTGTDSQTLVFVKK